MTSSPLRQQLLDQRKNAFFFNAIRRAHRKQEELNKLEYDWAGKGMHKVYPYKLDFGMCPRLYFRESETYSESYDVLAGSYRKSRGSAVHEEFQRWLLKTNIIAPKPTITLPYPKSKLDRIWPEIPILYEDAMISGQADGLFYYRGELCVLELKTTTAEEKGWYDSLKHPLINHQTQAFFYCDEINEQHYYDSQSVKWACIAYLNTRAVPGDPHAEKEFYLPFDEYQKDRVKLLKKHLIKERNHYLNAEESICTYPGCKIHAKV